MSIKTFHDPAFLQWLHELTIAGYQNEVMIETDHLEVVTLLFREGKTPEQALPEYIEFKRRWTALNKENK